MKLKHLAFTTALTALPVTAFADSYTATYAPFHYAFSSAAAFCAAEIRSLASGIL